MFTINLKIKGGELYVEMLDNHSASSNSSFEYAFYLIKNNERVDTRWYEPNNEASFNIEEKGAIYYIKGFARSLDKSKKTVIDSEIIDIDKLSNDLDKKSSEKNDIFQSHVLSDGVLVNGVYNIDVFGQNIHILFDGLEYLDKDRGMLVCFSGAITNRNAKEPPFFSGKKVARTMNMPLISISDPSLEINSDNDLTWYAGNDHVVDLSTIIANILDGIAEKLKTKFIFFGGSAGGFASLSVINQIKSEARAVVWNPQTSISEYKKAPVHKYLKNCFPRTPILGDIYKSLESTGIIHDLINLYSDKRLKKDSVLYMQNLGDEFQLERHASPFMISLNAKEEVKGTYSTVHGISFWLNDWGQGHIPPNDTLLFKALTGLVSGKTPLDVALSL